MKVLLTATVQSHICQFHKPLVQMLHDHGCEVHVAAKDNLAEKNGLKLDFVDKVYNIQFARSPKSKDNIKAYKDLKRLIDTEKYDIVHCNTPMGGIVTRLAARKARKQGTKVYYTAHGFHFYKGAPKKNWIVYYPIEKFMGRYTDKLITITKEDFALAKAKFKCDVFYIHGVGYNSDRFTYVNDEKKSVLRKKLDLNQDDFIILNVGELLPNKNQKTAIKIIKNIFNKVQSIKLIIAGNGPEKQNLENLIKELSLNDYVKLIGYTTKINDYIGACDLLLTCSYREGLPLNVMEALACGKPVVASRNRGHKELIEDKVNGFLCDIDNILQYSEYILISKILFDNCSKKICDSIISFSDKSVQSELKSIYDF